ncbi:hypothetical protein LAZ67_8003936 [Cordylochernes scorpioides]|uniref:Uncharacterized protein n=1 Tax=Cordylochernes scorpioides TaxID=51811 RepID=A0ABY6KRZ5_9ARAC|nr:hypothetical protein LAZ67_8003936 [Cordylochernes scorpioides]
MPNASWVWWVDRAVPHRTQPRQDPQGTGEVVQVSTEPGARTGAAGPVAAIVPQPGGDPDPPRPLQLRPQVSEEVPWTFGGGDWRTPTGYGKLLFTSGVGKQLS